MASKVLRLSLNTPMAMIDACLKDPLEPGVLWPAEVASSMALVIIFVSLYGTFSGRYERSRAMSKS